ncbi:hypothetical protein NBRC10512_007063 [Rhodotorula toruloides]|uniref:RHTO0S16e03290g1_1 n=2 Tax=Rhodotorula toruloides TaxID=5286 RepID=A0A061BDY1_RHOTO|nr:exonuclease 1 [Rhodotorula toruloides NP11]EMS21059.1 exonuclease 1 [Rhodotorula toruloides NP11]CDR48194.1 RHTO0S16e03290g1_1 [Rhodotorula toruloides]
MGISGLLPLLSEIQKPSHVKEWKGKTVAVDAYVWLHRGAYGCAQDLALGKPTVKYVNYAMHRVRMLKYYGVTPFLVFDGGLLPSKMGTEDEREKRRSDALVKGNAFLAEGKAGQARECFVKAVDVTPAMAFQLIKALRAEGVEYVVAPYEADPQLAYLEKSGIVDAIVTEDSDLLVFGCRNVLFKMDGEGACVHVSRDDFSKCREYNFAGWSDAEFRHMAILSGCDYLPSIHKLGLKTAYNLLRKYKKPEKVIQFVRLEGQLDVPRNYLDEFRRAELTFLHQHVFDPRTRKPTHLHPLPPDKTCDDLPFIGPLLDEDFARGLAAGEIDPISKEPMVDLCPDSFPLNKDTSLATPKGKAGFAPSSSKSKNAITPAQGSASLLSFFSRKTPAASTSSPVNPVKVVAANKKVQLVANPSRSADAKENEAVERKSKFFGAPAKKQTEAVRPDDEVVIVEASVVQVEEVEMQEDLPASDADAEAALRDVELEVELRSAVSVSSGGSTDAAVLRPEEDDVAVDGGAKSDVPAPRSDNAPGLAVTPGRQSRELSLPSAISSPASTPSRKRRKLSHDPDDLSHMPALTEQDDVLESDGGISSPAAASTAAEAGWASTSEAGDLPVSDVLSSPVKPVPVEALRIKRELDDNAAMKQPAAQLGLSSDPILLSSDVVDADDLFERTPRPGPNRKSPRRIKGPKAPAKSSSGAVKPKLVRDSKKKAVEVLEDTPKAAAKTGSSKKSASRKKASQEEEEDEAISEAVKTVAASWRARFMMPAAGVRTPRSNAAGFGGLPPTPTTTSRPPSVPKPQMATATGDAKAKAAVTSTRIPLSPRSTNRTASLPTLRDDAQMAKSSSAGLRKTLTATSPLKKARTFSSPDDIAPLPGLSPPDPDTSSSPVVVTNPRLLAFRFTGTVKHN